jgi:hypothetical protein
VWQQGRGWLLFALLMALSWVTYENAAVRTNDLPPPLPVLAQASAPAPVHEELVTVAPALIRNEVAPTAKTKSAPRPVVFDKLRPPVRAAPGIPRKVPRPAPPAATEAVPPDSDEALLAAIVAHSNAQTPNCTGSACPTPKR